MTTQLLLDEFNSIQVGMSPEARGVLRVIWTHFKDRRQWPPIRLVHHQFGGRTRAQGIMRSMSGSIVQEEHSDGEPRYQLSLLGVLLAPSDSNVAFLLERYWDYSRARFSENPVDGAIQAQDLARQSRLGSEPVVLLGRIVERFGMYGSFFREPNSDHWSCGLAREIDDFPADMPPSTWVRVLAMRGYDENLPVLASERGTYQFGAPRSEAAQSAEFSFVRRAGLRRIVSDCWREVRLIEGTTALRAIVILCGSVLEGLLLDNLSRCSPRARAAFKAKFPKARCPHLDEWTLSQLRNVAIHLGRINASSTGLSQAVLDWRNLVHPGRQVRKTVSLSEDEAKVAVSTVRIMMKDLGSRRGRVRNNYSGSAPTVREGGDSPEAAD